LSATLLDVNALVALHWRPHAFHRAVMNWMAQNGEKGWATCSLTQAGFVRILSTPAFHPSAPSPVKALALLRTSTESQPLHQFWSDTLPLTAIGPKLRDRIQGHKQVPDAYLLAMACHHNSTLVTFDARMQSLAPKGSAEFDALLVLRS
jgi:toxin-antitoxin system PIN domain toxin